MLAMIQGLDDAVARACNAYSAAGGRANHLIVAVNDSGFFKTWPFLFAFAWYWNRPAVVSRERVLRGIIAAVFAFVVGRLLQAMLPYRARPLHDAHLGLVWPVNLPHDILGGWSSMPSDHGVLFAGLTVAVLAISRPAGIAAALYALAVALLPRIYLGEHYLSDILVGITVGAVIAGITRKFQTVRVTSATLLALELHFPAAWYALATLVLAQLSQMFNDLRAVVGLLIH